MNFGSISIQRKYLDRGKKIPKVFRAPTLDRYIIDSTSFGRNETTELCGLRPDAATDLMDLSGGTMKEITDCNTTTEEAGEAPTTTQSAGGNTEESGSPEGGGSTSYGRRNLQSFTACEFSALLLATFSRS
jgi:hypothetical protein